MNGRRYPFSLLIVGAILCGGGAFAAQEDEFGPPTPPKVERPRLRVDEETWDWGKVFHGDKTGHIFTLHNDGAGLLKIISVKPT